jgi:integrase
MSAAEPIRDPAHVQALAQYFLNRGEYRNYALVALGVHTALRVSDLLGLRWGDVYDFQRRRMRQALCLTEKKTGKTADLRLHPQVVRALTRCFAQTQASPGQAIFANPRTGRPISRVQAYRILRDAGAALALPCAVSCHSLRKTFGYHAWKKGVSPVLIMEIFNHSAFAVTRRYLGITQDEKNAVYLGMSFGLEGTA